MRVHRYCTVSCVVIFLASGCNLPSSPEAQTAALTLNSASLAKRQVQSRRYDTLDSSSMMAASISVLQDLGYSIDETSLATGLINASKFRPGTAFRASIVVRPTADRAALTARVSFQAIHLDGRYQAIQAETIDDQNVYRLFFDKLSQSVFLEGHDI